MQLLASMAQVWSDQAALVVESAAVGTTSSLSRGASASTCSIGSLDALWSSMASIIELSAILSIFSLVVHILLLLRIAEGESGRVIFVT